MPTRETTMIEYMKMLAVYEGVIGGCCRTHYRVTVEEPQYTGT